MSVAITPNKGYLKAIIFCCLNKTNKKDCKNLRGIDTHGKLSVYFLFSKRDNVRDFLLTFLQTEFLQRRVYSKAFSPQE